MTDSGRVDGAQADHDPKGTLQIEEAHVRQSYRRYAPVYDLLFGLSLSQGRKALGEKTAALNPAHILEVGVGTGLTLSFYPTTARITGIDLSEDMLNIARNRVSSHDVQRISLAVMNGESMGFPDGCFDCVTLPYVLSVTPEPARLIQEVRRVCAPGGSILVINHFSGQTRFRAVEKLLAPMAAWLGFRSEFDMERHIHAHHWKVLSVEKANLFALSRIIHIRN